MTLGLLKIVREKCIYVKHLPAMHKTRHLSKLRFIECTIFNIFLNNFHNNVANIEIVHRLLTIKCDDRFVFIQTSFPISENNCAFDPTDTRRRRHIPW